MGDTIHAPGSLSGDQRITSQNGKYTFGVLPDGNLAVGGAHGAEWDLGIHDAPGARLDVQEDGNLVLYKPDGSVRWASNTSGQNARLVIQDDRNVVLYNGDGAVLWSPNCYVQS
ncbi:D-mannose binding lectin [Pseudonocardia thermophila]|jgi:D-mannose binding lectin.|uniref:D-mannose binding lectin n=1 Tax=Pseudonocardia thermophila TaxID=1848 RepID=A0A1M6QGL0_PSETH|nr:hypothetical protein [Pseudonocardia thermophila]SHK19177.1 D-mannose binding lectin [Pseudonocardia thermophila]